MHLILTLAKSSRWSHRLPKDSPPSHLQGSRWSFSSAETCIVRLSRYQDLCSQWPTNAIQWFLILVSIPQQKLKRHTCYWKVVCCSSWTFSVWVAIALLLAIVFCYWFRTFKFNCTILWGLGSWILMIYVKLKQTTSAWPNIITFMKD